LKPSRMLNTTSGCFSSNDFMGDFSGKKIVGASFGRPAPTFSGKTPRPIPASRIYGGAA
jgi:hypothetical protein